MELYRREVKFRLAFMERRVSRWTAPGGIVAILLLWQAVCMTGWVSELYLPAPTSILRMGWQMTVSGEIAANLQASLQRIAWGYLIGSAAGIGVGLLTGFSKLAEAVGNPLIYSLYPIPKIAEFADRTKLRLVKNKIPIDLVSQNIKIVMLRQFKNFHQLFFCVSRTGRIIG